MLWLDQLENELWWLAAEGAFVSDGVEENFVFAMQGLRQSLLEPMDLRLTATTDSIVIYNAGRRMDSEQGFFRLRADYHEVQMHLMHPRFENGGYAWLYLLGDGWNHYGLPWNTWNTYLARIH